MRYWFYRLLVIGAFCNASIKGAPVADWHAFRALRATTLSGASTSSPVLGSANDPSSSSYLVGYFDSMSLTNQGDRIVLSFRVSFTDVIGMSNNDDQFRFALFDVLNQPRVTEEIVVANGIAGQTDNWRGYWFGVDAAQSGVLGSIRKRTDPNLHPLANAGTVVIGGPTGAPVLFRSSTDPIGGPLYAGEMVIERTPTGLALAGFFGGNGTTNFFGSRDNGPHPGTFSAVGFLNGATTDCDQMNFHDIDVAYAVSNAIHVVNDPFSTSAKLGENAQFQVAWDGTGLFPMIQWLENGTNIVGATNRLLTIPVTTKDQNNNVYSAVIKNVFGDSITSAEAVLTVNE